MKINKSNKDIEKNIKTPEERLEELKKIWATGYFSNETSDEMICEMMRKYADDVVDDLRRKLFERVKE